jgi:hypothetical protein
MALDRQATDEHAERAINHILFDTRLLMDFNK